MKMNVIEIGQVDEEQLKFAVIVAKYKDKFVYVKHKKRETWEIPGGHREENEDVEQTAKRELFEETDAKKFNIIPICEYSVLRDNIPSYGRLYYAVITELGELPELEIGEVKLFDSFPENLTYPDIEPYLYDRVVKGV